MRLHAPVPHDQQPHLRQGLDDGGQPMPAPTPSTGSQIMIDPRTGRQIFNPGSFAGQQGSFTGQPSSGYDAGGTVNSPLAGYQQGSGGIPNPMRNSSAGMDQMGAGTSQATNAAGAAGNNSYGSWGNANAPITGSDPAFLGSTQSAGAPGTQSNNTFSPNSAAPTPNRPAVPTTPPPTPAATAPSGGGGGGYGSGVSAVWGNGVGSATPGDTPLGGVPGIPMVGSGGSSAYGGSSGSPAVLGGNGNIMAFDQGGSVPGTGDTSANYSLNLGSIADAAKSVYAANTQMAGNIPAKPAGPGGDTPGTTQPAPGPIPLRPGQTPFGQRVSDAERGDASMGAKRGGIIPKRRGFWRGGPADNDGYKAAVADIAAKTDAETKREASEDDTRIQGGNQQAVANTDAEAKKAVANTAASASNYSSDNALSGTKYTADTNLKIAQTPRVSYSTVTTNKGSGWKRGGLVKKRTGVKRRGGRR